MNVIITPLHVYTHPPHDTN